MGRSCGGARRLERASVVAAVAMGLTAAGCTSNTPSGSSPTPQVSPTSTATIEAARIAATFSLSDTRGTLAMAPGVGSLWMTFQGGPAPGSDTNGALVEIDTDTGAVAGTWAVGSLPVAVAVAGQFVWVANSNAGGTSPDPDANSVLEFAANGSGLLARYSVSSVQGVVGVGNDAWVVTQPAGQDSTSVSTLSSAGMSLRASLSGIPWDGLTWEGGIACGGDVYVASLLDQQDQMQITRLLPDGTASNTWRFEPGAVSFACMGTVAVAAVDNPQSGGLFLLNPSESGTPIVFGPRTATSIVALGQDIWAVVLGRSSSYVTAVDPSTGKPLPGVGDLGVGGARLAVVAGSDVWAASNSILYDIVP